MTAGLLTLLLSASPVGAPPDDAAPRDTTSSYNPSVSSPAGRATVVGDDSVGRASVGSVAAAAPAVGVVYEPAYCLKEHLHGSPVSYEPRAGDIVLFVSDNLFWPALYLFALTGEPYHAGIIVQMPDGRFGLLEAGPPEMAQTIRLASLPERFEEQYGRIFIRRRVEPLTAEQSTALTGFATRQEGKPYAFIRFLLQGTPIRTRGPIRTEFLGGTRREPMTYFCSELVVEALVAAGLIDAETARPRATVMSDLFYDESPIPYINKHLKLYPCWGAPQQWVGEGSGTGKSGSSEK